MTRTLNTIAAITAVLAVAALAPAAVTAQSNGDPNERTASELGQALGEPGEQGGGATALYTRTPTELGQRTVLSAAPIVESDGFDWGDAAIGAGTVAALGLIAIGGIAVTSRRAGVHHRSSSPAVSG